MLRRAITFCHSLFGAGSASNKAISLNKTGSKATTIKDTSSNKKLEDIVKKIQVKYRRKLVSRLINGHEKNLTAAFNKIKLMDILIFCSEVKKNNFSKALGMPQATTLALMAMKINLLNETEISTVLEAAQIIRVNNAIKFLAIVDEKGQLLPTAEKILLKIISKSMLLSHKNQPQEEHEKHIYSQRILKDFLANLAKAPQSANLIYDVSLPPTDSHQNIFYALCQETATVPKNNQELDNNFYVLSYGAIAALGKAIHEKNWVHKKYRLGDLTKENIDDSQQKFDTRLASISTSEVPVTEKTHGYSVAADGASMHDEYHRRVCAMIPYTVRQALNHILFVVRKAIGMKWSKELWGLVDRDFTILYYRKLSTEEILSKILKKIERYFTENNYSTKPFIWIIIIDMVNHANFWKIKFAMVVNSKTFRYADHIKFYQKRKDALKDTPIADKIYILIEHYKSKDTLALASFNQKIKYAKLPQVMFKKEKNNTIVCTQAPQDEKITPKQTP
jgi:hypothetical protein